MGTVLNKKDMKDLEKKAREYAEETVDQYLLKSYAITDFKAGAMWERSNSKVGEMLEMLERAKSMLGNLGEFEIAQEIEQLVKEATEL